MAVIVCYVFNAFQQLIAHRKTVVGLDGMTCVALFLLPLCPKWHSHTTLERSIASAFQIRLASGIVLVRRGPLCPRFYGLGQYGLAEQAESIWRTDWSLPEEGRGTNGTARRFYEAGLRCHSGGSSHRIMSPNYLLLYNCFNIFKFNIARLCLQHARDAHFKNKVIFANIAMAIFTKKLTAAINFG